MAQGSVGQGLSIQGRLARTMDKGFLVPFFKKELLSWLAWNW
jgi:hypothetical protein